MVPKYLLLALLIGVVALTTLSDAGYKPPEKEPPTPIHKPVGPKLPPPGHKPPTLADAKKPPVPKPPSGGDGHHPPGGGGHHPPRTLSVAKDGEDGHGHIPQPKPKPYEKPPVHVKPPGPYKPPYKPPHKPPSTD
ncbi:early nodulin-75 [Cocos nucifera]|uniref:Early nodulin-75 n=1 Tax=Cocos nucifera TaxID=13894 RepID=A0A8K0N774_COCNU|nr:early nodulin-75 [Cocos nucifera]